MANEARVTSGLQVLKTNGVSRLIDYQARPTSFAATVTGTKGPGPGSVQVSVSGTDIDFSQFVQPGLCRIQNQDATNYVTIGIYEPDTKYFYPFAELLPGESYVWRWARFVNEELSGTGTVTGFYNSRIRIKANTASCNVLVETFEK